MAPLFLVVGLLIKLTSQGPIFYRGPRVGKDGRIFAIDKFPPCSLKNSATTFHAILFALP